MTERSGSRILLVRHVATPWSERHILQGTEDPPIDDKGVRAMPCIAESVAALTEGEDAVVVSSPLQRAAGLAHEIARRIGAEDTVVFSEALREVSFGTWQGEPETALERDPAAATAYRSVDVNWRWPDGETVSERADLADAFIQEMAALRRARTMVVVSHGLILQALIAEWIAGQRSRAYAFEISAGSISSVDRSAGGRCKLSLLNLLADCPPLHQGHAGQMHRPRS